MHIFEVSGRWSLWYKYVACDTGNRCRNWEKWLSLTIFHAEILWWMRQNVIRCASTCWNIAPSIKDVFAEWGKKSRQQIGKQHEDFTHTNISPLGNAVLVCVYCLLYLICFFVLFSGLLETLLCVRTYTSQWVDRWGKTLPKANGGWDFVFLSCSISQKKKTLYSNIFSVLVTLVCLQHLFTASL